MREAGKNLTQKKDRKAGVGASVAFRQGLFVIVGFGGMFYTHMEK